MLPQMLECARDRDCIRLDFYLTLSFLKDICYIHTSVSYTFLPPGPSPSVEKVLSFIFPSEG
jgi:hypothetical protein